MNCECGKPAKWTMLNADNDSPFCDDMRDMMIAGGDDPKSIVPYIEGR
jgi:hypothetical protein